MKKPAAEEALEKLIMHECRRCKDTCPNLSGKRTERHRRLLPALPLCILRSCRCCGGSVFPTTDDTEQEDDHGRREHAVYQRI